jgi:hypothetical protein
VVAIFGVGVQVGGRLNWVGTKVGTEIVGGTVGYGNGLRGESGLKKITPTTTITIKVAMRNKTESTFQIEPFIRDSPYEKVYARSN